MTEHYFTADPDVPFERESFTTELWGHELTLETGTGVFSRGHLDHATAVLFRELPPPVQGQFLDLGCGYGVIGLAIARAVPLASVIGVDVNQRALLLANDNARAAGLDSRFVACTEDQVPRDQGVRVVHAHGLTLEEVGYPDDDELAAQSERTRARREAIDD